MSNKLFTYNEIELLSKNPYVKKMSSKGITYTDEFKRIFIIENEDGKLPREIFETHGLRVEILGMERIKSSGNRWRAAYRENGLCGLVDTRKQSSGRPNEKNFLLRKNINTLRLKISY